MVVVFGQLPARRRGRTLKMMGIGLAVADLPRRHDRPHGARAGDDGAARRPQLVDAEVARPDRAEAQRGGPSRRPDVAADGGADGGPSAPVSSAATDGTGGAGVTARPTIGRCGYGENPCRAPSSSDRAPTAWPAASGARPAPGVDGRGGRGRADDRRRHRARRSSTLPGLLHDECSAFHPSGVASPFFTLDRRRPRAARLALAVAGDRVRPSARRRPGRRAAPFGVGHRPASSAPTARPVAADVRPADRAPRRRRRRHLPPDPARATAPACASPVRARRAATGNAVRPALARPTRPAPLFAGVAAHAIHPLRRPLDRVVRPDARRDRSRLRRWPVAEGVIRGRSPPALAAI